MGNLTLWEIGDLLGYWEEVPPANVSIAVMAGTYKPKKKSRAKRKISQGDIDAMMAFFGS